MGEVREEQPRPKNNARANGIPMKDENFAVCGLKTFSLCSARLASPRERSPKGIMFQGYSGGTCKNFPFKRIVGLCLSAPRHLDQNRSAV